MTIPVYCDGFGLARALGLLKHSPMTQDWKTQFRADLERSGERAVRDEMNSRGGLLTGGEARREFVLAWLREKGARAA
jgi:hypothetical protein